MHKGVVIKGMKTKTAVIAIILAVFLFFAAQSFRSTLNPYVSFSEAAQSGQTVQVIGTLAEQGPINYDLESGNLIFSLIDEEGTEALVIYDGAKPENFEHADNIVLIGQYRDNAFYADKLLVKCPSKYEKEASE